MDIKSKIKKFSAETRPEMFKGKDMTVEVYYCMDNTIFNYGSYYPRIHYFIGKGGTPDTSVGRALTENECKFLEIMPTRKFEDIVYYKVKVGAKD